MMVKENPQDIPVIAESSKVYQCEACIKAKQHVTPFPHKSETKYTQVGELVVSDVWGPTPVESLQGSKYFVTFTDAFSCFSIVYFIKLTKEVRNRYKDFEALVKTQLGKPLKQLRTDGGGEYQNDEFKSYVRSQGTVQEMTAAHSSARNRIAEHLMHTLLDFSHAALAQHNLPRFLWQEAVAHVNFIKNRIPTRSTGKTPYELFFGEKAKVTQLEEFGLELWVLDQSKDTTKLDAKSHKYCFRGYGEGSCAFQYYKPDARQILHTRNAIFKPNIPPESIDFDDLEEAELLAAGGVTQIRSTPGPSLTTPSTQKLAPGTFTLPKKQPQVALAPLQLTTPPKPLKPDISTPAPPPPPSKKGKGKSKPCFKQPIPGVQHPSTSDRPTRDLVRHDYKQMHETGLQVPLNDTRPKPWIEEVEEKEETVKSKETSEEVVDDLVFSIEEEWAEYAYVATTILHDEDGATYEETLTRWDADQWSAACNKEITTFHNWETFKLTNLPPGFKPLTS
jgi:hypothetical protein